MTYVLWDWNGTLLDDTTAALATLNAMLAARGKPAVSLESYRDHFRFPVKPYYREIGMDVDHEDWDAIAREYHERYAAMPKRLNPDAPAALAYVKSRGWGQSIISALRQDLLECDTLHYGIRSYFDYVYGTDNLNGSSKLDRARQLLAILAPKVSPSDCVLIGDSLHDAEVASALGIRCLLCAQGSHSAARLRKVAPTAETLFDAVRFCG